LIIVKRRAKRKEMKNGHRLCHNRAQGCDAQERDIVLTSFRGEKKKVQMLGLGRPDCCDKFREGKKST